MRLLRAVSIVSVLCTVVILLYVVPRLLQSGVVDVDAGFALMVLSPALIGLPASFTGAIVGAACLLQRRTRGTSTVLMALGQLITMTLAAVIVVWALGFASTGWELITLPSALMVGQLLVAAGLIVARGQRWSIPA